MANSQIVTVETAKELGLLPEEFEKIKEYLGGRVPNYIFCNVERACFLQEFD